MPNFTPLHKNIIRFCHFAGRLFFTGLLITQSYITTHAQNCPPNIDFETGNFTGWTCYTGSTAAVNGQNVITLFPSGPVYDRHTMYSASSGGTDPYGGFPVNCPNGSGHSIRLGNSSAGTEAEGVSYTFTIPANQNVYSLVYYYAVVFQDPNHQQYEQPRMEAEVTNLTDNTIITCSSFTFFPYGSLLPGFFESANPGGETPVWCKDWSAVTINLDGMAGKTIQLFFKTADCTFKRHFGYAYIDVNSECSSEFVGATYCPDDTAVSVVAPYGYQSYTWFNNDFSQIIGTQQTITFTPPPLTGTTIAVQVVPYNGYGCLDTLYAKLIDTLTVTANAGPDTLSCNRTPVQIGSIRKPGLVYNWSPAAGLSNPNIANPLASPDTTTTYVLTANHNGGGCIDTDTVVVRASVIDTSIRLIGSAMYCITSGDSSILNVKPQKSIQWYKDGAPINGANQPNYRVSKSGNYYALLVNNEGCSINTSTKTILIESPVPGITYPVKYALVDLPADLQARQLGISVVWKPGINLDNPTSYTPVFKGSIDQLYKIEIKTAAGCLTTDTQLVKPVKSVELYVPTAFTPNKDGRNDILRPTLFGVKQLLYFRVFNRWGQLLFDTKTEYAGWDGTIKGILQSSQVVAWIAQAVGLDGNIYTRKGTSVLIR